MSISNNVVKAHSFARQAEEALENKEWEVAVQLFQQAADMFLLATNDTSDLESIKALQLLSTAQANKSKALSRHLQHFNSRNSFVPIINNPVVSSEPINTNSEPMDEISLSASENYFVGQHRPSTYLDSLEPNRHQDDKVEKKSPSDLWGWMERMLELLYLPESLKPGTTNSNDVVRDSSLLSSFYFVPDKDDIEKTGRAQDGGDAAPISASNSGKDLEIKELDLKVKELQEKANQLNEENSSLKKKLQTVYTERMQVSKENDIMKKNILQFRQEFRKKAHQLRDVSSSVGHLPSLSQTTYIPQREEHLDQSTLNQMKIRMNQMQMQIAALNEKCNRQSQLIERYERELTKEDLPQQEILGHYNLRGETMSSSPYNSTLASSQILESNDLSGGETPFEPDESLTSSQILS